ncbi:MAG: hypothetical protein RL757_2419 [Bacteroidota bacterium]|jgi:hypothetical protein
MKRNIFSILFFSALMVLSVLACNTNKKVRYREVPNTPAAGFDLAGSDAKAIVIADSVMRAMGGRGQWDAVKYLHWTFFGRRTLLWDKKNERVRIDFLNRPLKIIMSLKDKTGRVWQDGLEMTNRDSLAKYLDSGYKTWINDSYWLVMPFKLKDSGVTLKYLGEKENMIGANSHVLQLTFKGVGVTPDNKYWVYVNPSSLLVTEWAYFGKYSDETPQFRNLWADYRSFSSLIMLSGNRGEKGHLAPMGVYKFVPPTAFTEFDNVDYTKVK